MPLMKKFLHILFMFIAISLSSYAQDKDEVVLVSNPMPEFVGGEHELWRFLALNIKYPEVANKAGYEAHVIAQFIVEKDGTISHAKVKKIKEGAYDSRWRVFGYKVEEKDYPELKPQAKEALEKEVIRIVEMMPKWNPGKKNGKPVRVRYNLPISFQLN